MRNIALSFWNGTQAPSKLYFTKLLGLALLFAPLKTMAEGAVKIAPANSGPSVPLMVVGGILFTSIITIIALLLRSSQAARSLRIVVNELTATRERLSATAQELDSTNFMMRGMEDRYQNILYEAEVGMFQMETDGTCSYINSTLEKLSGLYQKKASKEGLVSAIHPEDRDRFRLAWQEFTQKDAKEFSISFRFRKVDARRKESEIHVACRVNKILDDKKEVESYIGWIWDISPFREECKRAAHDMHHFEYFIDETIEGFYKLTPSKPISTKLKPEKMTEAILQQMKLEKCSETFASMYGSTPNTLKGSQINALSGGCGLFKNAEMVRNFVENGYKAIGIESIRQDPRGNRLNLANNVIGQVEDDQLVAIWGSQRNISQQKRELAELQSQTKFMHRILNAMPADIHVKDTRCRYLYVSGQVAERTGIPEEDWVGKTIFEVLPATSLDFDHDSIRAMKTGKQDRNEKEIEIRGKKMWMETIQVPLVSDEGLVEGVVGFSIDMSSRRQHEDKINNRLDLTEKRLTKRDEELKTEKAEHGKTALTLQEINRKLRVQEAETDERIRKFEDQIKERQESEDILAQNKEELLKRQAELEDQIAQRVKELNTAAEKRRELEEIIQIKDEETKNVVEQINQQVLEVSAEKNRIEELSAIQEAQLREELALQETTLKNEISLQTAKLNEEIARRNDVEQSLQTTSEELDSIREETITLIQQRDKQLAEMKEHQTRIVETAAREQQELLEQERTERKTTQSQLKKTETLLEKTQDKLKELTEKFEAELQKESEARTKAEAQLAEDADELSKLQKDFSIRIDQETKVLKQELGNRQIREKAIRQKEKELASRASELEQALNAEQKQRAEQEQLCQTAKDTLSALKQEMDQQGGQQQSELKERTTELKQAAEAAKATETKLQSKVKELEASLSGLKKELEARDKKLATAQKEREQLKATLASAENQPEEASGEGDEARKKLEIELRDLRIIYDVNRKSTAELIRESKRNLKEKLTQSKEQLEVRTQQCAQLQKELIKLRSELKKKAAPPVNQ